jgi:hypothetical protein
VTDNGLTHAQATLDAWRQGGDDRLDPMRFHLIEALNRRACAHSGEARRLLDDRLSQLIEAYAEDLKRAAAQNSEAASVVTATASAGSALAGLNEHAANRHAQLTQAASAATQAPHGETVIASAVATQRASYPELAMLDYFREVWSSVRTQKQLRQSFDQVPDNAGPLNSSSLVHRSLSLMRELSPGYLQQFLSYVETLSWMEQLNIGAAPAEKEAPRAATSSANTKKSTRSKSR